MNEDLFKGAWQLFKKYESIPLSFTDAATIEVMRSNDIPLIMSLDEDFDRIPHIKRIATQ